MSSLGAPLPLLRFESLSLPANLALFAAAAVVVWLAGTRTARYADTIAERTGIGKAFIGALLLGGITSLPEAATAVTASVIGNPPLAVNNILGGIALQVAILVAADAIIRGRALSANIASPSLLLEAALLILLLTLTAAAVLLGDSSVLGVGIWSISIFTVAVLAFFLIHQHDPRDTWEPEDQEAEDGPTSDGRRAEDEDGDEEEDEDGTGDGDGVGDEDGDGGDPELQQPSLAGVILRTAIMGGLILVAGFVLARTGDALADQTGLGSSFIGAVLVAIATSLPEVSTTLGAVRLGEYAMAISNLFGANILDMGIIFIADVFYAGGPVLNEVGTFAVAAALLGILITTVYLAGMLERRKRLVWGLGLDSIVALLLYCGGIFLLYQIR